MYILLDLGLSHCANAFGYCLSVSYAAERVMYCLSCPKTDVLPFLVALILSLWLFLVELSNSICHVV